MTKKILIVDDSKVTRSMAMFALRDQGFLVLEAEDAGRALEVLQQEEVDMVITDLRMPQVDGVGLTREIRSSARFTELPIVLITGMESEATRQEAFSAGISSFLTKPFKPQQLLDLVRSVLC